MNKVLAEKPKDPQARFLKGLIFTEQGNTKDAIEIFTELTQDYPDLPEPYNNLAVIYASQGQYEKARAALEQSIRTHPSYATAYENLGDVYAKLASQAYDKALQLDSTNPGAQNKLSLVRELVGGTGLRPRRRPRSRSPWPTRRRPRSLPSRPSPPRRQNPPSRPRNPPRRSPLPRAPASRRHRGGERLGAGVVEEGRRRLPRLLCQGLQDARRRSARRLGKGPPRSASPRRRRSRSRSSAQSDAAGATARASVTFRQSYRSDMLKSTSTARRWSWRKSTGAG